MQGVLPAYTARRVPFTKRNTPGCGVVDKYMEHLVKFCQRVSLGDFGPKPNLHHEPAEESEDEESGEEVPVPPDVVTAHRADQQRASPHPHSGAPTGPQQTPPPSPIPSDMGQKTSTLWSKPKISLTWALKNDIGLIPNNKPILRTSQPLQPLRKQNNTTREVSRSVSPCSSSSTARPARRRRIRRPRCRTDIKNPNRFGYQIQDVDEFLSRATMDCPGNIPMVLSRPCVLYQTQIGGPQTEVSLPLGMVVNGVLKNRAWLYAQTPHGEEGYVPYACCLPLGILPPPSRPQPCWDTQTDIFPRPSGNRTDTEKMRDGTKSECGVKPATNRRRVRRDSGERSVDGLYLRASRKSPTRHTLLVISSDYKSPGRSSLSVNKGDVVSLVSSHLRDWFWVRDRDGKEGFIPAVVAGHGFL